MGNASSLGEGYEAKVARLTEAMKKEGLAAVLLYSSGQLSMLEVNPVLWLSGVLPMGPDTAVLVTAQGDSTHVMSLAWDQERVGRNSRVRDVRLGEGFVDKIGEVLREKGVQGGLGIVGWAFMPTAVYKGIGSLPEVRVLPADKLFASLTASPGPDGLTSLRRAGEIADAGFSALLAHARVGMPEYELAAEVEYAMRCLGSEDNFGMVTASDHNQCTHPPSNRALQKGDVIIAEITPAVGGQFVQLCRTAVVGSVSPLLREKFDIMEEAMEKSLEKVRPGNKVGEISRVMNEVFAAHGYAEYCKPPYIRVRGHGLGFMSLPFAEMVDENEVSIEEGMDFVVHPNQYIPETGYLMLGDTVWVTVSGYERLTRTPMELFTVEA